MFSIKRAPLQKVSFFCSWPGAVRSDHPARSVAAWGKYAEYLTKNHDLSDIFGETSPLAKFYKLDGKVLLIGAAFEAARPVKKAPVGQTELSLMRQRELVDFAVEWIEKNRTVV